MDFDALFFRALRRAIRHTPWYGSKVVLENIEIWKQERFDRRLAKRAAQVLVCSEEDRQILEYDNAMRREHDFPQPAGKAERLSDGVVRPFNATREGDVGPYRKSRLTTSR
jgi:hypothetical protein